MNRVLNTNLQYATNTSLVLLMLEHHAEHFGLDKACNGMAMWLSVAYTHAILVLLENDSAMQILNEMHQEAKAGKQPLCGPGDPDDLPKVDPL